MSEVQLESIAREICQVRNYQFVSQVGAGAFKETFHVRPSEDASLALKVFRPKNTDDRVLREIDAMKRCDHPNVGKLFAVDYFHTEDQKYLFSIEEFLAGGTLTERVEQRLLPVEEVLKFGNSLIEAVSHIASHGLVHRDLKPDNIMFKEDRETPVVVDLGLVRDLAESSLTQTWLMRGPGTPYFSAPEQLNNDKELIDWRTDQFSLGVVLSISVLGYHPFSEENETAAQLVERVAKRESPSPLFWNDISDLGLNALGKMISPWPVERFRTPEKLAAAWSDQGNGS
ncbi:protein kinase [Rubrobacter marinus]|uniref:Protein kinase n=1 Tax=Rubrobacter marinus TaxID=2653852 RepID=A0A6G8Q0Z0_9ACTN|nr:serine/threonine-protein kinase [Rubrobacter marinus]QIN80080.1 protein kinase [Rubrobacter marinus]